MSAPKLKVVKTPEAPKPIDLWSADLARQKAVSAYLGFKQKTDLISQAAFELKMSGFLPDEARQHLQAARLHLEDRVKDLREELMKAEEICFDLEEKHGVGHHNTVYLTIQFEREPDPEGV